MTSASVNWKPWHSRLARWGPEIQAACHFVRATGRRAAIGSFEDVAAVFAGASGTQVRTMEIRNLPVRVPIHGQVVVQIRASGLCHTDIHAGIRPVKAQGRGP